MTRQASGYLVKAVGLSEAEGSFSGYGAIFSNIDRTNDIIERGAFAKTLREAEQRRQASGGPFVYPLLWMHDPDRPIGGITFAHEDSKGLAIAGRVDLRTQVGQQAFSGMREGYVNGFSIGYDTKRATRDTKGVRHLHEIALWEISLITSGFAANEQASLDLASLKSAYDPRREGALQQALGEMMGTVIDGWRGVQAERARAAVDPDPEPVRDDYASDARFGAAWREWAARQQGHRLGPQLVEAHRSAFAEEVRAARDARVRSGMASLSELADYYHDHGKTASGQRLSDESARIRAAYSDLFRRIDAGDDNESE